MTGLCDWQEPSQVSSTSFLSTFQNRDDTKTLKVAPLPGETWLAFFSSNNKHNYTRETGFHFLFHSVLSGEISCATIAPLTRREDQLCSAGQHHVGQLRPRQRANSRTVAGLEWTKKETGAGGITWKWKVMLSWDEPAERRSASLRVGRVSVPEWLTDHRQDEDGGRGFGNHGNGDTEAPSHARGFRAMEYSDFVCSLTSCF